MPEDEADYLIASGALILRGFSYQAPHTRNPHTNVYVDVIGGQSEKPKVYRSPFFSYALGHGNSWKLYEQPEVAPWKTLEQPSMIPEYATPAGCITLNNWISATKTHKPKIPQKPAVEAKKLSISYAVELISAMHNRGLNISDENEASADLLFQETHNFSTDVPGSTPIDKINHLIAQLNSRESINFSLAENQVVSKFLHQHAGAHAAPTFWPQLAKGINLYRRLVFLSSASIRADILWELPLSVSYTLALSALFLENITCHTTPSPHGRGRSLSYTYPLEPTQHAALCDFAAALSWPTADAIREHYSTTPYPLCEEANSHAAQTWFSGLILPGPISSWLLMLTLAKTDRETASLLENLADMHPDTGFQYARRSYLFHANILGKVLGGLRAARQHSGWISVPVTSEDIPPTALARALAKPVERRIKVRHIERLQARTDPLGPPEPSYVVGDYRIPRLPGAAPSARSSNPEAIELLTLRYRTEPYPDRPPTPPDSAPLLPSGLAFSVVGQKAFVPLRYDVSFVAAPGCAGGSHVLWNGYGYACVDAGGLLEMDGWRHFSAPVGMRGPVGVDGGGEGIGKDSLGRGGKACRVDTEPGDGGADGTFETPLDTKKVLVVDARGESDARVLVRAWCAKFGLSAVVVDVGRTCVACAVRMGVAAGVGVVVAEGKELENGDGEGGGEGVGDEGEGENEDMRRWQEDLRAQLADMENASREREKARAWEREQAEKEREREEMAREMERRYWEDEMERVKEEARRADKIRKVRERAEREAAAAMREIEREFREREEAEREEMEKRERTRVFKAQVDEEVRQAMADIARDCAEMEAQDRAGESMGNKGVGEENRVRPLEKKKVRFSPDVEKFEW
ncbi:MAG: hypothetical protein MMC23_003119 [Stictis urceolatum]|nr:hypothetical protein [Stictis urceolata]